MSDLRRLLLRHLGGRRIILRTNGFDIDPGVVPSPRTINPLEFAGWDNLAAARTLTRRRTDDAWGVIWEGFQEGGS